MNSEELDERGGDAVRRRSSDTVEPSQVLAGGGRLGALMRATAWSGTALPPIDRWPQSLRSALGICLGSRFPIAIYWGPELALLYNDAWSPIAGDKHPWALGRPARQVWPEIWDAIGPLFEQVMAHGESTYSEDSLLLMHRHGYTEECYFNFTFTPIRGEGGRVEGVFNAVIETTFRVISERRTKLLRELGESVVAARAAREACDLAVAQLGSATHDVAFVAIYVAASSTVGAALVGSFGLPPEAAPAAVSMAADASPSWPLAAASRSGQVQIVGDLEQRFGARFPGGAWPEPAQTALVAPIMGRAAGQPHGFLILGASPRRAVDDEYLQFAERAASHIGLAMTNASAYEEERKRAELLAEMDRAKTAFFSNVSHEFRTPLTLMLGPTEDLLSGAHGQLSVAQRAQLELLHRNELRLERLVNALLEFSRMEAGRVEARFEAMDLARLTRDLASSFRAAIERAKIRFVVDCTALNEPVYVDVDLWEQIVLNLLSNAFKFTFQGEIALTLRRAGSRVVLEVRDTGVGVPPEEVPRLFERFHRVEGARARTHEGSGIGLALVHELTRLHGGTITAESEYGRGTTFRVALPLGSAHLPQDRIGGRRGAGREGSRLASAFVEEALRWLPNQSLRAGLGDDALAEPAPVDAARLVRTEPRVLIADDNTDMREYLARILGAHWVVEAVADGASALEAARRQPPDLILSDAMMPVLDGVGLLKALREQPSTAHIPVIMLSARVAEESRVQALDSGADDYMIKPFSARELVARVRAHMALSRLRRMSEVERDRLRALLSEIPAIINFLRGPELVFEFVHPRAKERFKHRDVLGKPLLEALPELASQPYPALLRRVVETGERAEGKEMRVLHDDGQGGTAESYWDFVYVPVRDAEGKIEGVMTFDVDVTEQVVARQRIEAARQSADNARRMAESAVRLRDEFLAIASHELRTPLTALSLQLEGLLRMLEKSSEGDGLEVLRRRAEHARTQADRLEGLIAGMLDVFSLGHDRIELQLEDVDLAEVTRNVVEHLVPDTKPARAMLELSTQTTTGRWDRRRLEQVVTQLVSNALKFGAGKTVHVAVEDGGDCARLSVSDRGIGIASGHHERIFERFGRATSPNNYGGFGLGLWMVRELVTAMHGSVRLQSEPGRGAQFVVELPKQP